MSYCRWSDGMLYIFKASSGGFVCMACPFEEAEEGGLFPPDFECATLEELREHVREHEKKGHDAPYASIYSRIHSELLL